MLRRKASERSWSRSASAPGSDARAEPELLDEERARRPERGRPVPPGGTGRWPAPSRRARRGCTRPRRRATGARRPPRRRRAPAGSPAAGGGSRCRRRPGGGRAARTGRGRRTARRGSRARRTGTGRPTGSGSAGPAGHAAARRSAGRTASRRRRRRAHRRRAVQSTALANPRRASSRLRPATTPSAASMPHATTTAASCERRRTRVKRPFALGPRRRASTMSVARMRMASPKRVPIVSSESLASPPRERGRLPSGEPDAGRVPVDAGGSVIRIRIGRRG